MVGTLWIPGLPWSPGAGGSHSLFPVLKDSKEEKSPNLQRILLRLHHLFEIKEDPVLSQPVTLDLKVNGAYSTPTPYPPQITWQSPW